MRPKSTVNALTSSIIEGYEYNMGDSDEFLYWPSSGVMPVLKGTRQPMIAAHYCPRLAQLHWAQHMRMLQVCKSLYISIVLS